MKIMLTAIGLLLLFGLCAVQAETLLIKINGRPVVLTGGAPDKGCVAQLNDSSCRPDKFPLHNPDPAIPSDPVDKEGGKAVVRPQPGIGLKSQDCRLGAPKCYCTNKMAASKAGKLGMRDIQAFGFPDSVRISGRQRGRRVELIISRERSCPVISDK